MGTLVSNHLLPSSRKRKNCQSNSSGSRRLNRGSCCTPKFALLFSQEITTLGFSLIFKIGSGIDQTDFSLAVNQESGFLSHFSEEIESTEIQFTVTLFSHFFKFAERLTDCSQGLIIWDKK